MNVYLILLLRVLHVVGGVLWVGGAAIHTLFIEPTAKATGPEGSKFVQYLMGRRNFAAFMNICSAATILAGGLLFWNSSGGLQPAWLASGPGVVFTVGSVIGIVVYLLGLFLIKPRAERLAALGRQIGAAGGPPAPAQLAELQQIDQQMSAIGRVDFALLMGALFTMATARYWFV
jgi:hypothetical protein